jgi:catecholate siderophore receptor
MGVLVASAVITAAPFATTAQAAPIGRLRYEDAIAEVLGRRRSDLLMSPSWRIDLNRFQSAVPQQRPVVRFDIAAGLLGEALATFEQLTGITVTVVNDDVRTIQSPGVSGVYTPEQALERLLTGTGASFQFTGANAVSIVVAPVSEFVAVTGRVTASPSSPKFTAPLRDIPQTIAVIPREIIQAQGATTLRDVLRNVPGITFQAGEGGGGLPGDSFTLRGFPASNDMFIDGVRDAGGYSRDTFNIEQVEVAKGPSSSIAGRGTTGGAVNQVTKSPMLGTSQDLSVGVGDTDVRRGTLDLNQRIGGQDSNVAVRLNAMWGESGVAGRDVVENSSWGVAPSISFGIGRPTEITLKSQHLRQDNVPDYGLPWGVYPGYPTGAFEATPPIDQSNFYGLRNYDFENIENDAVGAEVRHRFANGFTLRNLTRYSDTDRDSAITAPRPPNRQLQRRTMGNENLANLTNLNAALGADAIRHDIVAGVEVARETTHNQNSAQTANQPAVSLVSPNPSDLPFGPMPPNTGNPSETVLNQLGLYAFDTVKFGEKWQLTGGLRWDAVNVDFESTALATGQITAIQRDDQTVSWRAGVVYKPRPVGSLYLAYGTSFNPSVDAAATGAGFNPTPTAPNNPSLEPEETRSLEAGTKWDAIGSRLSLTAAVFRTEKINARTRNLTSEPFVLDGRQRVDGVELGVSGSITDRWSMMAAYALMNSEIVASANVQEQSNDLTLTPESTFNVWTTLTLPQRITLGGGAQYMDTVFRNTLNTQAVPSYWLVNGLASYAVNEHLTLRLNLQNLTDEQYVDRIGGGHYIPGPRRQVLISSDFGF